MSAFPVSFREGNNMMWVGWPDHPGYLFCVTEYRHMPRRNRPARAIAIAATESRRRLLAIGINCALAASLAALLAMLAF